MLEFILNSKHIQTDLPPGMVMLDFIRYEQNLKGTKIGCREGDCGACTVLVGELQNGKLSYRSMTSCLFPIGNAQGKHIVSVEGINGKELNPVQQAIVEQGGTQCGFCTVGFVMSLVGFCMSYKKPDFENALAAMDGNICRCTGYKSLERAAGTIVEQLKSRNENELLTWLVQQHYLPDYFETIPLRLKQIDLPQTISSAGIKVGGGTDLYVQKHDTMVHEKIQFVLDDTKFRGIHQLGNILLLGASTTVEDIRSNELMQQLFPKLKQHLKLISSTPIRNMATLAGNFVNASPIGDMSIFFLGVNAQITLNDGKTKRNIFLKDFFKGYKAIDKLQTEWIEAVFFEIPKKEFYFNFEKVSKRKHLDIASVNSAIQLGISQNKIERVHIAFGGVFAYPRYLQKTVDYLLGKEISSNTILAAEIILQQEIAPISDARGSAEYKRLLARQLFFAHFMELFPSQPGLEELIVKRK